MTKEDGIQNLLEQNDKQAYLHRMAFAKEQAIAFAAYTAENLWTVYSRTGMWYQHMNEDNPITGEQLYNQFIEQQNKDNGGKE